MNQIFNRIYIIVFFLCMIATQISRIYISKINNNKIGVIIYSALSVIMVIFMIIAIITIK